MSRALLRAARARALTSTFILFMLVAVALGGCKPYGERAAAPGKGEVFFKPPITKDQASRLGRFLHSVEFFDNKRRKSVQLRKVGARYLVRYVVKAGAVGNGEAVLALKIITGMASREVFDGALMAVELCDERFKKLLGEQLPKGFGDFGERLTFGKGELFIKKPVTVAEGNKVGELLLAQKFFLKDKRKSVQLVRDGDTYVARFVTGKTPSAAMKKAFAGVAIQLSAKSLAGKPVRVEFCTAAMKTISGLAPVEAGAVTRHGKGELYRLSGASPVEAAALAKALQRAGYFNATSVRAVQVDKKDGRFILRFAVRSGSATKPDVQRAFAGVVAKLGPPPGGTPVDVFLTNGSFREGVKLAPAAPPAPRKGR